MRLTLRHLQIFHAVALRGSTTAAALSLPLSQSATSAALNELARPLGTTLFDRVGKRLLVNDNGRTLLPATRAVLDGARVIETLFSAGGRGAFGDLNVFASTTIGNYVLPGVFARYRELHSDVRLVLRIGNSSDVIAAVREYETDLGFIEGPCHDGDIRVLPWREDELVIVAAPGAPLAVASQGAGPMRRAAPTRAASPPRRATSGSGARSTASRGPLRPEQLMAATWLLREPGSGTRQAVEQALLPHLPNLGSTMTFGSSEAIKNAVAEGLGISCLSLAVVQDLVNAGRLKVLATRLPRLSRRFSLIHHRGKVLSASLRAFVAYCQA